MGHFGNQRFRVRTQPLTFYISFVFMVSTMIIKIGDSGSAFASLSIECDFESCYDLEKKRTYMFGLDQTPMK